MPYRLLIFDWDGTLADSAAQIVGSMQAAIAALALPARADEQIRELIGLGLMDGMERLYPELDTADVLRLLDDYRARFVGEGPREAPLFAGALDTLTALHGGGHRLAIATGKSRRGLERSLAHHHALRPLLCGSRCADETAAKPDPLMLRELLAQEDVAPAEALFVGDTEYDVQMGVAIGMPVLGVTCGVHAPQRLRAAGALALIDAVRELPAWLAGAVR